MIGNPKTMIRVWLTTIILIFIISKFSNVTFAATPSNYTNGSSVSNIDYSKIINYINSKRSVVSTSKFLSNIDTIKYYETFFDVERDYEGLPFSTRRLLNSQLTQQQKKMSSVGIKILLTHNPNVYDNPVEVHPLSGKWLDATVVWSSEADKWELQCSELFKQPLDTHRGQWTLCVSGLDSTGKSNFDERSYGYGYFNIHKAPIAKMTSSQSGNTLLLSDHGSYDYDYQYSKANNGIANYAWEVKVNNQWISVGTGKSLYYNTNGATVTDYRLTVTDYDGAKASVTKSAPPLVKPVADFFYMVGGSAIDYVYQGNAGNEVLIVKDTISWNDEEYVSTVHSTSGTRSQIFKALKTSQTASTTANFNTTIRNYFGNLVDTSTSKIGASLTVKNKYDLSYVATKYTNVRVLSTTLSNNFSHIVNGKVIPGTTLTLNYKQNNANINLDEVRIVCTSPMWSQFDIDLNGTNNYSKTITLPDYSVTGDSNYYDITIYSRRDGSKLHTDRSTMNFNVPLKLDFVGTQYYIPDDRVHINLVSNEYVNSVSIALFNGTNYQTTIQATNYKTVGTDKYWTVSYKPPADIPLQTYQAYATGTGIGGLTINASASMYYLTLDSEVTHTTDWESNRQKYNKSKTGNTESPRTKDIFFNGEKFVVNSKVKTNIPDSLTITSVSCSLVNTSFSTVLSNSSTLYTGTIFNTTFKTLWEKPNIYNLTFRFTTNISTIGDLTDDITVKVDSTDVYWRDHLKD